MFDEPNFQDFPLRFETPGAGHSHYSCDRCLEFFSFEFGGRRRG